MKNKSKLSTKELENFEEAKLEISKDAFNVMEGLCPKCKEKMVKYIDNKSLFEGALTFHIIKFKCLKCKKEYLDLNEAQKYDLFLKLEKVGRERALALISEKKAKQIYA